MDIEWFHIRELSDGVYEHDGSKAGKGKWCFLLA